MALIHYAGQGSTALNALKGLTNLMKGVQQGNTDVNRLLHDVSLQAKVGIRHSGDKISSMEPNEQIVLHQLERGYLYELEEALPALAKLNAVMKDIEVPAQLNRIGVAQLGSESPNPSRHAEILAPFVDIAPEIAGTSARVMISTLEAMETLKKSFDFVDHISQGLEIKVFAFRNVVRASDATGTLTLDLPSLIPVMGIIAAIKSAPVPITNYPEESSIFWKPVEEFELSIRTSRCLQNANIKYVGQLVVRTEADMLKTKNFGRKSLKEIKEVLNEIGVKLGMKVEGWTKDGPPPPIPVAKMPR